MCDAQAGPDGSLEAPSPPKAVRSSYRPRANELNTEADSNPPGSMDEATKGRPSARLDDVDARSGSSSRLAQDADVIAA